MSLTRRRLLQLSLGASALHLVPSALLADVPGMTFGVQLFMLREQAKTDLPGVFKEIRDAGFPQVELYPIAYTRPAAQLRQMVRTAGLGAVAGHFDYVGLEDRLGYARDLGLTYMVCPMLPKDQWTSLAGFRRAADLFNRVGEKAKAQGMEFVFHNHDYEFRPMEGSNGFTELMSHTDAALVKLEFDMYWLTQAGQDPVTMLKQHADRVRLIYLKDRLPDSPISYTTDPPQYFTELGRGTLNWKAILRQAHAQRVQYAFLDQDETALPIPESMKISREYLRQVIL